MVCVDLGLRRGDKRIRRIVTEESAQHGAEGATDGEAGVVFVVIRRGDAGVVFVVIRRGDAVRQNIQDRGSGHESGRKKNRRSSQAKGVSWISGGTEGNWRKHQSTILIIRIRGQNALGQRLGGQRLVSSDAARADCQVGQIKLNFNQLQNKGHKMELSG